MTIGEFFKRYTPLLAITAAFTWSCYTIVTRQAAEDPPGVRVLHVAHWQLELSLRDAIDQLGKDFANTEYVQRKYGKVVIKQEAIPESVYGQWISANMIAGTAPDLVEVGNALPYNIWLGYKNRYMLPLTNMANQVNPFNKGTELEKVPLRLTFIDDMRIGYQEEMQQYMQVPLSRFTTRVFYNKTLLRKLTGLDVPPSDFRSFLAICDKITQQKDAAGQPYIAIASSKYHVGPWTEGLCQPISFQALYQLDFNRDGAVGNDETFAGVKSGRIDFMFPPVAAQYNMLIELMKRFQTGFAGLGRDEAVFLIAQQKAVFICTGTWDVGSLVSQAEGVFELGVVNYPQPSKADPEFGKFVDGPNFDPAFVGFAFGMTRFHPENFDLATDFLYYLSSLKGNTKLNQIINWVPYVKGVPSSGLMKDFAPITQGQYYAFNMTIGGNTQVKSQQEMSTLQTDSKRTYKQFVDAFEPYYKEKGLDDWNEVQRDWRRTIINNDKFLSGLRGEALLETPNSLDDPRWIKYRAYITNRQVSPGIDNALQVEMVHQGPSRPVGPYEYLPEARANARRQMAQDLTTQPGSN